MQPALSVGMRQQEEPDRATRGKRIADRNDPGHGRALDQPTMTLTSKCAAILPPPDGNRSPSLRAIAYSGHGSVGQTLSKTSPLELSPLPADFSLRTQLCHDPSNQRASIGRRSTYAPSRGTSSSWSQKLGVISRSPFQFSSKITRAGVAPGAVILARPKWITPGFSGTGTNGNQ